VHQRDEHRLLHRLRLLVLDVLQLQRLVQLLSGVLCLHVHDPLHRHGLLMLVVLQL